MLIPRDEDREQTKVVAVKPALVPGFALVQYSMNGRKFWRTRKSSHIDIRSFLRNEG